MISVPATFEMIRRAGRTARGETRHIDAQSSQGGFDLHMRMLGFEDDSRREEIVATLAALYSDGKRIPPVGDGLLHLKANTNPVSVRTALTLAVGKCFEMLKGADVTEQEFIDTEIGLTIEPSAEQPEVRTPRNVREKMGARLGRHAHGLSIAAAEMYDLGLRQNHGGRSYEVEAALVGLDETSAARIAAKTQLQFGKPAEIPDGHFVMTITCEKVGSAFGAILLAAQKMGDILDEATADCSLHVAVTLIDDEDN